MENETCEFAARPLDHHDRGVCGAPATKRIWAPDFVDRDGNPTAFHVCNEHFKKMHEDAMNGSPLDSLFTLRDLRFTQGAKALLDSLGEDCGKYLMRHVAGDWGEYADEFEDNKNRHALKDGGFVVSVYKTPKGALWIQTKTDGLKTTVGIPSEVLHR